MRKALPLVLALLLLTVGCRVVPVGEYDPTPSTSAPAATDPTPETNPVTSAVTSAAPETGPVTTLPPPAAPAAPLTYLPSTDGVSCTVVAVKTLPEDGALVIPATIDGLTVTAIASRAFLRCLELKSVTLPDTLTRIGAEAFSGCSALERVTFPHPSGWTVGSEAISGLEDGESAALQLRLLPWGDWVRAEA